MKIILKTLISLIFAGFPMTGLFAQQDVITTSADSAGSGGSSSWSVGTVAFSLYSSGSGTITEGSQQPYEIFIFDGVENHNMAPECTVSPNPTTGKVTIRFSRSVPVNFTSCLYNLEGIPLSKAVIDSQETIIPMDDLKPATYFLVILENEKPVKNYKIIKK